MTRQQRRQAERRIKKGGFPFPEFGKWIGSYAARNRGCYLFCKPERIRTNLSGEEQILTLDKLYTLLTETREKDQKVIQEQLDNEQREQAARTIAEGV